MIIHVINQLPTSFRRVVIVMSLLLAAVNVAWGQAVLLLSISNYQKRSNHELLGRYTCEIRR